ncbi:DNA type IV secretion system protein ComB10 [Campylobacter upsaliensis]|uniref:VirB10 n=1 Tax=Campylobacter upsaliensis TaxID=28080 RepID=A0A381EGU5_CAMUP|nr:DNA type IV secretion system protein ComB10 [Campylobacter upsaliensis]MCR2100964.1 DNA type IV secretion system protein ComB10 [Campylobacter upsaliensis]SUX26211.1 VirB10 [Campylobacter upsaliensis]
MKKAFKLSFILALLLHQNALAESIFERDTFETKDNSKTTQESKSIEQNNSKAKHYDSLIEFKANEENLNYLFKDSKFPVDDYLYKGGFKKPTQDVHNAFKNLEKEDYESIKENANKEFRKKLHNELLAKSGVRKGDLLLDKYGKPKKDCNNEDMYSNILYNEKNCPILDCNQNPQYKDVIYDEKSCPLYDEKGNLITSSHPKYKKEQEEKQLKEELLKQQKQMQEIIEQQKKQLANLNTQTNPYNSNLNELIRKSILADRNTNIYFSKPTSKYGVDSFSNQKNIDIATNEHRLYRTLRAGRLIPAVLTTAISSDIEGLVTAQVEQDIYASMGRAVLIPRGSKVIGFYKNDNKIGQNRLAISWREIITPQGVNILLTNAIASDNMGMSGALGEVNNKYLERYGMGYGLSTLSNVLLLSLANKSKGNSYGKTIYDQSNTDVTTIVSDIIEQQKEIKPTIEIKQGSRIYITPTAHIWFPKPKNGEVLAEFFKEEQ